MKEDDHMKSVLTFGTLAVLTALNHQGFADEQCKDVVLNFVDSENADHEQCLTKYCLSK